MTKTFSLILPHSATMFTLPAFNAVITPLLTVAIVSSSLYQVIVSPSGPVAVTVAVLDSAKEIITSLWLNWIDKSVIDTSQFALSITLNLFLSNSILHQ